MLKVPPNAPKLDAIEQVWDELCETFFANRAFKSLDAWKDHVVVTLNTLELDLQTVGSIVSWPWIIGALMPSLIN